MFRLTMALAALFAVVSLAPASFSPRKDNRGAGRQATAKMLKEACNPEPQEDLVISDQTEIRLDGKACKYEEVPSGADIVLLEVSADKRNILKIHFQSKK